MKDKSFAENFIKKHEKEYEEIIEEIENVINKHKMISATPLMSEMLLCMGVIMCRKAAPTQKMADDWIDKCIKESNDYFKKLLNE